MGRAGRRYAERTFSPETAADRFVEVFRPRPRFGADFGRLGSDRSVRPASRPRSVSDSVPDGRPVTGKRTVRDQDMSWSDPRLIDHTPSSTMGDVAADNKVAASGPFPHHVG